jgi:hypothetical protein
VELVVLVGEEVVVEDVDVCLSMSSL